LLPLDDGDEDEGWLQGALLKRSEVARRLQVSHA
jgi:hypothetical protein